MSNASMKIIQECEKYLEELHERELIIRRYVDARKGITKLTPIEIVELTYKLPKELMDRLDFEAEMREAGIDPKIFDPLTKLKDIHLDPE